MRLSRRLTAVAIVFVGLAIAVPLVAMATRGGHGRPPSVGADAPLEKPQKTIIRSVKNDVSRPLRTMVPIAPQARREAPENRQIPGLGPLAPAAQAPDPVVQSSAPTTRMPASTSFDGLASSDNSQSVLPPDTNGDVGPSNYVEFVNLAFAIYSKTGTRQYGPADGSTLWSGFGGPCELDNDGDPVVLYDPISNRWLFSQFALPNYPDGPFYQCLAVSTTYDPTGSYYRYAFKFSDTTMNDYPKFGVWPDGYYMSAVQFGNSSSSYAGAAAVVYDRAKMVAGQPATAISFNLGSSTNPMLPSDLDGSTPPPAGSPNYYGELVDGSPDRLKVWAFHTDWATPANATFTLRDTLTTAPFDTGIAYIDEPNGYTGWLDALADRPMYRFAYRNFGSRESLVMNHTVNVSGHAGVRWYELRKTGTPWSIFQQGTFSPDSNSRWMGSLAMDQSGNIAVGYSVSSSTVNPGIRYAGRLASDPAGVLSQGEATLQAGGGIETDFSGRWGDYSSMSVDPSDDCTFWYANEYFATTSDRGWRTRIGSFKFPGCGVPVVPAPTITSFAPTSGPVGTVVTLTGTNFTGATSVQFGSSTSGGFVAASFNVVSPTSITVTIPSGKSSGHFRVTTPSGTGLSSTMFTVTAQSAPTVSGFSPSSGPVGSTVTITGTNFTGATGVALGTSTAGFVGATYSVTSATSISVTVPSGRPSGQWRVTTPGGTALSTGTFTVATTPAPTIASFSPSSGPVGSTVTITGTNFTGATAVKIGTSGSGFVSATFTVVSPTSIRVTVPAGRTAPGHWRVTTPGGSAMSSAAFTVT